MGGKEGSSFEQKKIDCAIITRPQPILHVALKLGWPIRVTLFGMKISTASLTTPKPLIVWITTNCGKFLDGNTIPPYLPPEKPVCRSRSNSWNWNNWLVQNWEKNTTRLNTVHAEYIMRNARPDESQTGIKIARKNINNLGCADDTTLNGGKWKERI